MSSDGMNMQLMLMFMCSSAKNSRLILFRRYASTMNFPRMMTSMILEVKSL